MLWRVQGQRVHQIEQTILADQELLERDLETWIESNPDILGEPLLIVGRQVHVQGVNDRLDLLALDPGGNTVIIEVKRGELKDPVDIQALRYASYISRWPRRKIEQLAEAYHAQHGDTDSIGGSFEELFSDFASEAEEAAVPSLNGKQRIVIVGHRVQARLGSVALWLLQQGIDIKVVEVTPFKDPSGTGLLLSPQIIIPPPSTEGFEVGGTDPHDPWVVDGQKWHLEHRCRERGRQILLRCVEQIGERFPEAQGPIWAQKHYISFRVDGAVWLYLHTRATQLNISVPVPPGKWNGQLVATRLGIGIASKDDSLSEKLAAPTSVRVRKRKGAERLDFFIKDDALLASDAFWELLETTRADLAKGW